MCGYALYVTKVPHFYDLPLACMEMPVVSNDFILRHVIFLFFFFSFFFFMIDVVYL